MRIGLQLKVKELALLSWVWLGLVKQQCVILKLLLQPYIVPFCVCIPIIQERCELIHTCTVHLATGRASITLPW